MNHRLDIDPAHLAQVRQIIDRLVPADVEVLVFGSRARGGAKRYSDLDLALRGAGVIEPSLLARLADMFEESNLPWRVDLVDYNALSPEFLAAVRADMTPLI